MKKYFVGQAEGLHAGRDDISLTQQGKSKKLLKACIA